MLGDSHAFSGFSTDDIDAARSFYTDTLGTRVTDEDGIDGLSQDERGIARDYGPPIAWFTDPGGNILCVLEL